MAALARFLADTSALARYPHAQVAARLDPLVIAGLVATCALVDLQLLYTTRGRTEYARLAAIREASFAQLTTTDADLNRAKQTQASLAERGQHRIAWPDLVIAAVAERHQVTLLHYDAGYDLIAGITGQATEWVAPKGALL
jgi:predicted nucleic acid-binding protein